MVSLMSLNDPIQQTWTKYQCVWKDDSFSYEDICFNNSTVYDIAILIFVFILDWDMFLK